MTGSGCRWSRGRTAAMLVAKLATGMKAAHANGVIHRDLKPGNILLEKGEPVIVDFGLARQADANEHMTKKGAVIGTPSYMAPEQVRGDDVLGPGCDVYALGIILYELLAGRRPFEGPPGIVLAQILYTPASPPSKHRPDLDPRLEAVCLKAMAKTVEDRLRLHDGTCPGSWLRSRRWPPPPRRAGTRPAFQRSRSGYPGRPGTADAARDNSRTPVGYSVVRFRARTSCCCSSAAPPWERWCRSRGGRIICRWGTSRRTTSRLAWHPSFTNSVDMETDVDPTRFLSDGFAGVRITRPLPETSCRTRLRSGSRSISARSR